MCSSYCPVALVLARDFGRSNGGKCWQRFMTDFGRSQGNVKADSSGQRRRFLIASRQTGFGKSCCGSRLIISLTSRRGACADDSDALTLSPRHPCRPNRRRDVPVALRLIILLAVRGRRWDQCRVSCQAVSSVVPVKRRAHSEVRLSSVRSSIRNCQTTGLES